MGKLENQSPSKPLLRGVLHEVAAFVAAVAGAILVFRASGARARAGALVYGISLVSLFAVSAIYHRPDWSEKVRAVWRRLDHSAIFLLIAGTYTPSASSSAAASAGSFSASSGRGRFSGSRCPSRGCGRRRHSWRRSASSSAG